jgi:cytochrome c-type biogenesis protein CcmH
MKYILLFCLLVFLGLTLLIVQPGFAQEITPAPMTVTDDQVNAIARQLYCPVCENVPLDVCPTKACAQWRDEIRVMLAEGKSEREIKDYFVRLHGVRVLATPPARGLNWLIYIIPPVAILGGVFILYSVFRQWRWSGTRSLPPAAPVEPEEEYIMRLEEELRKR